MNTIINNGTYHANCRTYGNARKIVVFNSKYSVYTPNGVFCTCTTREHCEEMFGPHEMWKKVEKRNSLYNLVWMVQGEIKEVISQNVTYPVAAWKKKQVEHLYTQGMIIPVPSNLS